MKNLYEIAKIYKAKQKRGIKAYREYAKASRRKASREARNQKVCLDMFLVVEE